MLGFKIFLDFNGFMFGAKIKVFPYTKDMMIFMNKFYSNDILHGNWSYYP